MRIAILLGLALLLLCGCATRAPRCTGELRPINDAAAGASVPSAREPTDTEP